MDILDQHPDTPTPTNISRARVIRLSFIYFGVLIVVSLIGWGVYVLFFASDTNNDERSDTVSGITSIEIPSFDEEDTQDPERSDAIKAELYEMWAASGDSDGDGLSDELEAELGTNPMLADSDGDFLRDAQEIEKGTDPLDNDTDDDGISDWNDDDNGFDVPEKEITQEELDVMSQALEDGLISEKDIKPEILEMLKK